MKLVVVAALACACSSKPAPATPAGTTVALPGAANGLYWDSAEGALYLTDATHDTLVRWTDAGGFAVAAQLPQGEKLDFGGLTRAADGTFAIASFGFGSDGAVLAVAPGHPVVAVPGLDKTRRRIGITRAPDGTLYDAYFVVDGHTHTGGVAKLDLATGETDVVAPAPGKLGKLGKAVGVAATAAGLLVDDQESGSIYAIGSGGALTPFATGLAGADLLTVLPDGSLITGGKHGEVLRIAANGTSSTAIATGLEQVRGTAYDPARKRLFVVDHSKASRAHTLHILPLAL